MRHLFVIAILCATTGLCYAQGADSSDASSIDLHLDFITANGAFLSLPLSSRLSLRIGMEVSWDESDEDRSGTRSFENGSGPSFASDTFAVRRNDQRSFVTISASSVLFVEVFAIRRVSLHCGFGPSLTYEYVSGQSDNFEGGQTDTSSSWGEYSTKTWAVGAMGVISARVFLARGISFHADYALEVRRSTVDVSDRYHNKYPSLYYENNLTDRRTITRWSFDGFTAGIIVAL